MYPQQRVRTASAAATLLGDSCKCYGAGSRWRGKLALVTGASAGIGRDIAVQLCATVGMRVVGCSRRGPDLQSAIDDVVARTGGSGGRDGRCEQCGAKLREAPAPEFFGVACDLTRDADIASLFASIDAKWPGAGIDVVINNAGIAHEDTVLEGTCACRLCTAPHGVWHPPLPARVRVCVVAVALCVGVCAQAPPRRGEACSR